MMECDSEHRFPAPSSIDRKDVVNHCLECGAACEKSEPRAGLGWTVLCSFSLVVTYTEFQH